MLIKPRLWRQLSSWFKSFNLMSGRPQLCGATVRRSRRLGTSCFNPRGFTFEGLEPRQLLASDIQLAEFGATGTHLVVNYDIAEETAPAFNVSVYRSSDGVTRDALVGTREVTLAEERAVGRHAVGVGISFTDVRKDYRLIAVVDPANNVAETSAPPVSESPGLSQVGRIRNN